MKIAFVWDWEPNYQQSLDWQDGLAAAIHELKNRGHGVTAYADTKQVIENPLNTIHPIDIEDIRGADVILHWADFTRPHAKPLKELGKPMALCFTGGEIDSYNTYDFDHVFVESQVYADKLEEMGVPHSIAFGTNTDLFTPLPEQNKQFDTVFPATFAAWKRHDLYAAATQGLRSLAVGFMYDDHEQECWQECLRLGVTVLPHASAEVLRYLYAASRICVVPSLSSGGSQRTVLEAMAMNLPLIITDSDKYDYAYGRVFEAEPTVESIRGHINAILDGGHEPNTREYVLENWSHIQYADALEKELGALL